MTYYYIKQNDTILLSDTDKQRFINTLNFMPDYKNLLILETNGYIIDNQIINKDDYVSYLVQKKEDNFKNEFFETSLGYIRRKVTMSTNEIKDFLSDLLPVISLGIQSGREVSIITYNKPDFTQELTNEYIKTLQETKKVTSDFIQECFLQLSNDFLG
ncbi:MAG: hypothetical protein LUH11_01585 [Candidatus Gastranaerophilales bacterium]|nr:hypothetical protein [Candidatus Gastranaerophilales bacterium]